MVKIIQLIRLSIKFQKIMTKIIHRSNNHQKYSEEQGAYITKIIKKDLQLNKFNKID